MSEEERRELAEEQVNEGVAMIYNYTFNKEKSWEDCYKELAIKLSMKHQRLWENYLKLKQLGGSIE